MPEKPQFKKTKKDNLQIRPTRPSSTPEKTKLQIALEKIPPQFGPDGRPLSKFPLLPKDFGKTDTPSKPMRPAS